MHLTDAQVRNAKPKAKFYRLRDGNSLFLHVDSSGGKYWRFMYRYAEKQKTLSLERTLKYPLEKHGIKPMLPVKRLQAV